MKTALSILFAILFLSFSQQKTVYFTDKQGKPTTYGITAYVKNHQDDLIKEYERRIDTLYDINIYAENLGTEDEGDLGEFYIPDQIVITNHPKYIAYEFSDLSKFKQRTSSYKDRTVKAVIFHELTHAYFYKIVYQMRTENIKVSPEYSNFRMYPMADLQFGAEFIEEGICEYVIYYLNESAPIKDVTIPDNETDLLDNNNKINNIYYYSVIYIRDFLNKEGLKKGIEILIKNRPPNYKEILKPELFFNRLQIN